MVVEACCRRLPVTPRYLALTRHVYRFTPDARSDRARVGLRWLCGTASLRLLVTRALSQESDHANKKKQLRDRCINNLAAVGLPQQPR